MLVNTVLSSIPRLGDVAVMMAFLFVIIAITGLVLMDGIFYRTCRADPNPTLLNIAGNECWHWEFTDDARLCGGSYDCSGTQPGGYCFGHLEDNNPKFVPKFDGGSDMRGHPWCEGSEPMKHPGKPETDFIHFDNVGAALLIVFQSMTVEGWTVIMYDVQDAFNLWFGTGYFVMLVFVTWAFLLNIALAVVDEARQDFQDHDNKLHADKQNDDAEELADAVLRGPEEMAAGGSAENLIADHDGPGLWVDNIVVYFFNVVATSEIFMNFIMFIIIANVVTMMIDGKYPPDLHLKDFLSWSETIFLVIFCAEMVIMLGGYGPKSYWLNPVTAFDGVIVIASVISKILGGGGPFTALRVLRLFRVLNKLAYLWPQFKVLMKAIIHTGVSLNYWLVLFALMLYIFTLMSQYFFARSFYFVDDVFSQVVPSVDTEEGALECPMPFDKWECVPRAHFETPVWAFVTVPGRPVHLRPDRDGPLEFLAIVVILVAGPLLHSEWAQAQRGPGAVGGKLTPERRDAMLAMSAEHFEACSIWLSPGQKAHLLGLRAVQTGDPLALSRHAKQQHDTLKDQVAKAKNAWEKSQEVLAKQLQKTAELKAKYVELEAKELEAARAAASAFTELGRASRPQPADHAAYLVEQLRELGVEAGVVDSIKQVAEARQKAKKDEEEAAAAKARDHDLDMDAAIGNLKQGDWLDKLVSSAGESGITRSQLEAALDELAVCFLEALDRFRVFDYVVMDYFATVASDTAERLHKQATQLKIVNWDRWVKTHSVGTGCGYDQVPPRSFLHLPDIALELLCGLIGMIEEQELDVLRSQAAAALDAKTSGKSRTLALALAPQVNYDPIWRATLEPIKAFSSVLWASRVPCHVLEHGLGAAKLALSGKDQMWPQVRGPFGALYATLTRVGIVVVEPLVWKLPDGLELKLTDICPRVLLHCCAHAVRHWVNLQISEHLQMPEFRTGFWDGPLKYLLSAKGDLTWQQRGYLRSAIIGAQWPQDRQFQQGWIDSPNCLACQEAPGTLVHRHAVCKSMLEAIGEPLPDAIRLMLPHADQNDLVRLMLERVLVPLPKAPQAVLQMPLEPCVKWYGDAHQLTGDLYLDGSLFIDYPHRGIAAWAVVALAADSDTAVCTITGLLPFPLQDIDGAELYALLAALRFAVPPVVMHTDSDFVWKGVHMLRQTPPPWACAEQRGDETNEVTAGSGKGKTHISWRPGNRWTRAKSAGEGVASASIQSLQKLVDLATQKGTAAKTADRKLAQTTETLANRKDQTARNIGDLANQDLEQVCNLASNAKKIRDQASDSDNERTHLHGSPQPGGRRAGCQQDKYDMAHRSARSPLTKTCNSDNEHTVTSDSPQPGGRRAGCQQDRYDMANRLALRPPKETYNSDNEHPVTIGSPQPASRKAGCHKDKNGNNNEHTVKKGSPQPEGRVVRQRQQTRWNALLHGRRGKATDRPGAPFATKKIEYGAHQLVCDRWPELSIHSDGVAQGQARFSLPDSAVIGRDARLLKLGASTLRRPTTCGADLRQEQLCLLVLVKLQLPRQNRDNASSLKTSKTEIGFEADRKRCSVWANFENTPEAAFSPSLRNSALKNSLPGSVKLEAAKASLHQQPCTIGALIGLNSVRERWSITRLPQIATDQGSHRSHRSRQAPPGSAHGRAQQRCSCGVGQEAVHVTPDGVQRVRRARRIVSSISLRLLAVPMIIQSGADAISEPPAASRSLGLAAGAAPSPGIVECRKVEEMSRGESWQGEPLGQPRSCWKCCSKVFQVMTGENWNWIMYAGMRAKGWGYALYFVFMILFGQTLILSLFLTMLMSKFDEVQDELEEEEKIKIQERKANKLAQRRKLMKKLTASKVDNKGLSTGLSGDDKVGGRSEEGLDIVESRTSEVEQDLSKADKTSLGPAEIKSQEDEDDLPGSRMSRNSSQLFQTPLQVAWAATANPILSRCSRRPRRW
ncbi:unnamed protein product [Prorocentrum cordatum]|uniref:Ion transport domain-containing protein n=1 Tax=Prorocentrum cordatum TaxID=2364126 RepID=A0ABN9TQL6_9DINO|nr:unnamed protein product [Polarella glacialis]